jgi:hydroxyacylglutathione hydrolase
MRVASVNTESATRNPRQGATMADNATFIQPFVDESLGNSSYLVGSRETKTAVLIDPLRDVDRYRHAAEQQGVQIKHVLDTHIHNDFISGARELAAQVGAEVGISAAAGVGFEHRPLLEGDRLPLGADEVRVLATPGHTPEHLSFLLTRGGPAEPRALFSGGALMVGGAARTDLLGHEHEVPLARQLYHTLHHKLLALPDDVDVFPTHGAGSFCAAPASSRRTTTIGRERRTNHLALAENEDEFIQRALHGLPSYPVYYHEMAPINRRGPKVLGGLPVLEPLSPEEVNQRLEQGAAVLDVRRPQAFAQGHIPGSFGIQVKAPLATWAGWLIPFGTALVLVADDANQRIEAVRQLIRIGYDNLLGYLDGGVDAWAAAGYPLKTVERMSAAELRERLGAGEPITVLDVRQVAEWDAGRIPGSVHLEAGRLPAAEGLPKDRLIAVTCASGNRSMAGISALARRGYTNLVQVEGGLDAWRELGFEVESGR